MKKNNIKPATMKDINMTGNTLLRALRIIKNYDYRNAINFYQINGPFTVNQVKTEVAKAGFNTFNATITILLKDDYFNDEYNVATLTAGDTVNTDFNYVWFNNKTGATVHRFIAKSDFNTDRKKENAHAFVICQLKENMTAAPDHKIDLNARFKVTKVNKWCKQWGGVSYIGDIETTLTDAAGQPYTHKKTFKCEETNINNIIDKSGYFVEIKRNDLNRRAAALRADRAKNAYKETNNAGIIAELKTEVDTLKNTVIEKMTAATTGAEMEKAARAFKYFGTLPEIMTNYERIVERDKNKDYATITDFENAITRTREKINKVYEEINK